MKVDLPHAQKGAAAIEFALVFVIFFSVLYGVLSYSFPLLLMQSFNQSTAEAVRRSMAVDPTLATADYKAKVESVAKGVLDQQLGWMPTAMTTNISKTAVYSAGVLTVTVSLPAASLCRACRTPCRPSRACSFELGWQAVWALLGPRSRPFA